MDEVNVAVIAPILGRDLSFVSDVDPRVRVFDANFAALGHRAEPGDPAAPGSGLLAAILAQAEVLLVGFPVPEDAAALSPRLLVKVTAERHRSVPARFETPAWV